MLLRPAVGSQQVCNVRKDTAHSPREAEKRDGRNPGSVVSGAQNISVLGLTVTYSRILIIIPSFLFQLVGILLLAT